jgi:hypothetical protein
MVVQVSLYGTRKFITIFKELVIGLNLDQNKPAHNHHLSVLISMKDGEFLE